MKRVYPNNTKKTPYKRVGSQGFADGLNTLGHPIAIKNSELSEVTNAIYSQYGTIGKRGGSLVIGSALANSTKIISMGKALSMGTGKVNYNIRISDIGKPEYLDYADMTWKLLTGTAPAGYTGTNPTFTDGTPTFNTTVKTNIAQLNQYIFFANSINELVYWDGSAWFIYTAVVDPTVAPTVAKTGSGTGSTNFFYKYCDVSNGGTTKASPVSTVVASMPATLDTSTYLTVTIPAAATGTTKRTIYRGITAERLVYVGQIEPTATTYVDKFQDTPQDLFPAPTENSTKGYHFYTLDVYSDTLVGTTVEMGKDVIVYTGGIDPQTFFLISNDAGYIGYRRGQGDGITTIKAFAASNEDGVYILKRDKIGKMKFITSSTVGGAAVTITDVNIAVGSPSPMSVHVAGNNMRFWSEEGPSSIGNEANYGTILRYSVMGLKSDYYNQQVNQLNLDKIAAEYYKHLSIYAVPIGSDATGNNSGLVYDERYNAWAYWTGFNVSCMQKFIDNNNVEKLYAGSSKTGNVLELFNGKTDERTSTSSGTAIRMSVTTKQYGDVIMEQKNRFNRVVLIFGTLSGNSTTLQIQQDGVYNGARYLIPATSLPRIGFGSDVWGQTLIGQTNGTTVVIPNINFKTINLQNALYRNLKLNITNSGMYDELELIGIFIYYKPTRIGADYTELITELATE